MPLLHVPESQLPLMPVHPLPLPPSPSPLSPSPPHPPSNIYQILAYVLFFFNFMFGFCMCLLRVFALTMFTIVMLFRVDVDVYMRGLEGWDTGRRRGGGEVERGRGREGGR